MSEPILVNLKTDPQLWVKIKDRWTYGDKIEIAMAPVSTLAMLSKLIVDRHPDVSPDAEGFDDTDAEHILDEIIRVRNTQIGKTADPNS